MAEQSKRFRLRVVGGAEQVPRLLAAYGKSCDGEFALVLRPREARGLLVLIAEERASIWQATAHADVPRRPTEAIAMGKVVPKVNAEKREDDLPPPGPVTLRGEWAGEVACDGGNPVIVLRRKLATYGTLVVQSDPARGWRWAFHRQTQWFTEHGAAEGDAEPTLSAAIDAGIRQAMKMVAAACQVRDTSRRAAMDPAYAEKHPLKTRKVGKDPTERLNPKEPRPPKDPKPEKPKKEPATEDRPRRARQAEPASNTPAPLHAPVPLPPVPANTEDLARLVGEVKAEADALRAIRSRPWAAEDRQIPDKLSAWFQKYKLGGVASELDKLLSDLRRGTPRHIAHDVAGLIERVEGSGLPKAVTDEAREKLLAVQRAAEREPMPMERARRLIRYAMRLIDSKLCQGEEREQAVAALQKAVNTYENAREQMLLEASAEVSRDELRKIAEAVSLSAAKVARACGNGQQTVLKPRAPKATEAPVSAPAEAPKKRARPRKSADAEAIDPAKDAAAMDALEARLEQFLAKRRKTA